jgi:hypothetical protein
MLGLDQYTEPIRISYEPFREALEHIVEVGGIFCYAVRDYQDQKEAYFKCSDRLAQF